MQTPLPGAAQYADQFWGKTYELMRLGRAWVVTGVAAASKPIVSSPIGATAKALGDGTKTNIMRFFHHLSKFAAGLNPNGMSDREGHGGCFYPIPQALVRQITVYKPKYPGAFVLLDLFDVNGAFTNLETNEADVCQFATDMPFTSEQPPDVEKLTGPHSTPRTKEVVRLSAAAASRLASGSYGTVARLLTVIYLTGTFGHVALPPQYGLCAMKPISDYHNSFCCARPELHGPEPLTSWTYVDDTVDVVLDFAVRRWISRDILMKGFYAFIGASSINVAKASAGYGTRRVAWGLGLDTVKEQVFYTPPRVKRLRDKVYDEEFDRSFVGPVKLQKVASLHGSMRNMRAALRPVRAHHRAVSRLLATSDPARIHVVLRGSAARVKLVWQQFYDAIDQLRLLADDDAFWASGYLSSFTGILTPTERLLIPGEASRRVYWGSDATPDVIMVVDHLAKEVAILIWTTELEETVRDALTKSGCPPAELGEVIISIKELSAPVLGACLWGHKYADRLIICPVDNQTACFWVAKLEADNFFANGLLNVLARQMVRNHNELITPYIHTERNVFADTPTRAQKLMPEALQDSATVAESMATYVKWLDEHHPGYHVIDMAATANHYFGALSARLTPRLHDDAPESCQAKAARERSAATPLVPSGPPAPGSAKFYNHYGSGEERSSREGAEDVHVIEGCAGCGQVSAEVISAGAHVHRAIELDETARFVFASRHPSVPLGRDVLEPSNWNGLDTEEKRQISAIFGGWPCPSFSQANPDAKGGGDVRAWLLHTVLEFVLADPDFNYHKEGRLTCLAGENVVGKEEWMNGEVIAREAEVAWEFGYVRTSIQLLGTELGDVQARVRLIEWYEPWQMARWLQPLALHVRGTTTRRLCDVISSPSERQSNCWVDNWNIEFEFEACESTVDAGRRPSRAGFLTILGRRHHVWRDDGFSWTVKASGEQPKGSGGAFYRCSTSGRVYVLSADDAWALQGIPARLLDDWRGNADKPGVPFPSDTAVRRIAGNAITTGTARFVANDLLVGRTLDWRAMVAERPELGTRGEVTAEVRFGDCSTTPPDKPPLTRDADIWRGGESNPPTVIGRRYPWLVGWFVSLLALTTIPGSAESVRTGSFEEYMLDSSYEALVTRYGQASIRMRCGTQRPGETGRRMCRRRGRRRPANSGGRRRTRRCFHGSSTTSRWEGSL